MRLVGDTMIKVTTDEVTRINMLLSRDEAKAIVKKGEYGVEYCPTCGRVTISGYDYCPKCGQRLDHQNVAL